MAGLRVHVVMPESLVARIDAACPAGVSRGEFVRRAVEQALDGGPAGAASGARVSPTPAEPAGVEQASGERPVRAGSSAPAEPPPPFNPEEWVVDESVPPVKSSPDVERMALRSPVLPPSLSSAMAKRDVRPVPKGKP